MTSWGSDVRLPLFSFRVVRYRAAFSRAQSLSQSGSQPDRWTDLPLCLEQPFRTLPGGAYPSSRAPPYLTVMNQIEPLHQI